LSGSIALPILKSAKEKTKYDAIFATYGVFAIALFFVTLSSIFFIEDKSSIVHPILILANVLILFTFGKLAVKIDGKFESENAQGSV
jgi:hypothetical protein